jgi:hypothetical protein
VEPAAWAGLARRAMIAEGAKVVIGDILDAEGEALAKEQR